MMLLLVVISELDFSFFSDMAVVNTYTHFIHDSFNVIEHGNYPTIKSIWKRRTVEIHLNAPQFSFLFMTTQKKNGTSMRKAKHIGSFAFICHIAVCRILVHFLFIFAFYPCSYLDNSAESCCCRGVCSILHVGLWTKVLYGSDVLANINEIVTDTGGAKLWRSWRKIAVYVLKWVW